MSDCRQSHILQVRLSVSDDDCNLFSKICNKPLTLIQETTPELSLEFFPTVTVELLVLLFSLGSGRGGKTFSVPCNETLLELEQPFAVHLREFEHCQKKCCPFRHERQSLLLVKTLAFCVGVFPRNTGQRHRGCVSLQLAHLTGCVGRGGRPTISSTALDIEANIFNRDLVFVITGNFHLTSNSVR